MNNNVIEKVKVLECHFPHCSWNKIGKCYYIDEYTKHCFCGVHDTYGTEWVDHEFMGLDYCLYHDSLDVGKDVLNFYYQQLSHIFPKSICLKIINSLTNSWNYFEIKAYIRWKNEL